MSGWTTQKTDDQAVRRAFIQASLHEIEGKRPEALAAFTQLRGELKRLGYNGRIARPRRWRHRAAIQAVTAAHFAIIRPMSKGPLLVLLTALCLAQTQRDLRLEPASRLNPLRDSGTRWAVIVGISSYQHLPPEVQLRFAHRDAAQFSTFLQSTGGRRDSGRPHPRSHQ